MNVTRRSEVFPNIRRKYTLLNRIMELLHPGMHTLLQYFCSVHHGMPDFLCYRDGVFKFVECKLQYECLSERQKKCISKLQSLGFLVEVHKLVDERTKIRSAFVDLSSSDKLIIERQLKLMHCSGNMVSRKIRSSGL